MVQTKVPVNVPGLSSFDKSCKNILTAKVGTIVPLLCKTVIPNSRGSLKLAISAALPPLASDTFMRCNLKVEAFFVPMRLLYGGFEAWLTGKKLYVYNSGTEAVPEIPRIKIDYATWANNLPYLGPGSLADYLDARVDTNFAPVSGSSAGYLNAFKFLCYHRVYDDWYRNAKVQQPVFTQPMDYNYSLDNPLGSMPYLAFPSLRDLGLYYVFHDGSALGDLRQRNWDDDYFSIATTSPQVGAAQSIDASSGSFTIAALRAGNSIQQFSERSNLASPRMQDYVKAHYGASLATGVAQRAVLLGSASYPVYSKGVEGTTTSTATNNPFTSVGARYGNAYAAGTDFVCNFEANEPGYLLVNATLVPEACFSSGIDKEMRMFTAAGSQVDLPDPLLENVGNEPIYTTELSGEYGPGLGMVFGYVPRNTRHKCGINSVHGLLRNGQSLASFAAQRSFFGGGAFTMSDAFLKIPTTALDNITAVTAALSNYGVWIDSYIDLKVSEPLVESAMPSLQDPAYEHGKTEWIQVNGSRV